MADLFYVLLGLISQGLIPWMIGYFLQMSLLKKGKDSSGKFKCRWIILPALTICVLSAAGINHFPLLEDYCAGIYLLAFMTVIYTAALAFGGWSARSDFLREKNS